MALNPILVGLKLAFEIIRNPEKRARLPQLVQEYYHDDPTSYESFHEIVTIVAKESRLVLENRTIDPEDFVNTVLTGDSEHPYNGMVLKNMDRFIEGQFSELARLKLTVPKNDTGKRNINEEQSNCISKLKALKTARNKLSETPDSDLQQLYDEAAEISTILIDENYSCTFLMNAVCLAKDTYHYEKDEIPKELKWRCKNYKIEEKYHQNIKQMVRQIHYMFDIGHCSATRLLEIVHKKEANTKIYQLLSDSVSNKELLRPDADIVDGILYDEMMMFDRQLYLSQMEEMMTNCNAEDVVILAGEEKNNELRRSLGLSDYKP